VISVLGFSYRLELIYISVMKKSNKFDEPFVCFLLRETYPFMPDNRLVNIPRRGRLFSTFPKSISIQSIVYRLDACNEDSYKLIPSRPYKELFDGCDNEDDRPSYVAHGKIKVI
jgi:hypothetical protein